MPGKGRHIIAGIAWVLGSLIAWALICNILGFVIFIYLGNERQVKLPAGTDDAFNWASIVGLVLVPAIFAVLAIRACLPGTGARSSKRRGFPVQQARRNGPA
jgi:hypothetical protein